jgi:putative transposase
MQFTLQTGLTFKQGFNLFELVRVLSDGRLQFENTLTRSPKTLTRADFLSKVYAREYSLVLSPERLAQQVLPAETLVDLSTLAETQRTKLDLRYQFVKALQKSGITRGQRAHIEQLIDKVVKRLQLSSRPSSSAVMHWARQYAAAENNPLALVDRRRKARHETRLAASTEKLLWKVLRQHYFTRDRHKARHAYEQLLLALRQEIKQGHMNEKDAQISYATFTRRIQDVDVYHRVASREGSARARMVCRTSFPEGQATYPLQRVEIDHTPLNWVVICDRTGLPLGRPVLTAMIDAFSGYVLGFYLSFHGPGLTSVCGVARNAILPKEELVQNAGLSNPWLSHGLGDEWVIDNGLEFHSFGFRQMGMALGVDIMYCRVRTPWLKPHVERFFGTLNSLTLVKGRVSPRVANALVIDPYKDAAISFSDLVQGLLQFVVDVHPFEPNWRKMARPFDLFQEGLERCPPAMYPGSLEQLKLAAGMSKVLSFTAGGIELMGLPYGSYEFKALANQQGTGLKLLCKWDPDDMSHLYVQHPTTHEWLTAQCRWPNYANGLSYNQHRLIRHFGRQQLRSTDKLETLLLARQRLHEHWMSSAMTRPRKEALLAARAADFTSSKVLAPKVAQEREVVTDAASSNLVLEKTPDWSEHEVPDFESISL